MAWTENTRESDGGVTYNAVIGTWPLDLAVSARRSSIRPRLAVPLEAGPRGHAPESRHGRRDADPRARGAAEDPGPDRAPAIRIPSPRAVRDRGRNAAERAPAASCGRAGGGLLPGRTGRGPGLRRQRHDRNERGVPLLPIPAGGRAPDHGSRVRR